MTQTALKQNNVPTLAELKLRWLAAKQKETDGKNERLDAEGEIFMLVEKDLKETGVNNLPEGIKITTGFSEKWDQKMLDSLEDSFEDFWPFKREWKKDAALLKVVKDRNPDAYLQLTSALTLTPSKPSFEVKE